MKLGVKIGPTSNWQKVLEQTQARYCEVWFRLDWLEKFQPMFNYLRQNQIKFGLHFWAVLNQGFEPNLIWENNGIATDSQRLMQQTIDIAHQIGAHYVNVHAGSLRLKKLYLDKERLELDPQPAVDLVEAQASLLHRCQFLHQYAQSRHVLFLVETLPKYDSPQWSDLPLGRLNPQPTQNISPPTLFSLSSHGILITNDFAHLASSWDDLSPQQLWLNTWRFTKKLLAQTKLIHCNTVTPPFNGTDSHNGVLPQDFSAGVFPNQAQLIKLLSLFKHRDEVWIIPEPPAEVMVKNYLVLKQLINQI